MPWNSLGTPFCFSITLLLGDKTLFFIFSSLIFSAVTHFYIILLFPQILVLYLF